MRRILVVVLSITCLTAVAACDPKGPPVAGPAWSGNPPMVPSSEPPSVDVAASGEPGPTSSPAPNLQPKPPASPKPSASSRPAGCSQGEHQLAVERALIELGGYGAVTADGRQSAADCVAIKKFQQRYDLRPANGRAGPVTNSVSQRLLASRPAACGAGSELTACVDMTHQTVWIMKGGRVVYGPTVTRTGMRNWATRPGTFTIGDRAQKNWSEEWDVYLPYWQRIDGGNGFHQTTTYLHDGSIGSHGCVNLLPVDAVAFWNTLKSGAEVRMFGRRPGT